MDDSQLDDVVNDLPDSLPRMLELLQANPTSIDSFVDLGCVEHLLDLLDERGIALNSSDLIMCLHRLLDNKEDQRRAALQAHPTAILQLLSQTNNGLTSTAAAALVNLVSLFLADEEVTRTLDIQPILNRLVMLLEPSSPLVARFQLSTTLFRLIESQEALSSVIIKSECFPRMLSLLHEEEDLPEELRQQRDATVNVAMAAVSKVAKSGVEEAQQQLLAADLVEIMVTALSANLNEETHFYVLESLLDTTAIVASQPKYIAQSEALLEVFDSQERSRAMLVRIFAAITQRASESDRETMKELHMYRRVLPLVLSRNDLDRPLDALCVVAHIIGDVEQHPEWTLLEEHLKELRDCLRLAVQQQPYRGVYYPVDTPLYAIRRLALNDNNKPLVTHMCLTDIIAVMDPSTQPTTTMSPEQRTAAVELAVGLIFSGQLNLYQTVTLQRVFQSLKESDPVDRIRRQAGIGLFNLASVSASDPSAPPTPALEGLAEPASSKERTDQARTDVTSALTSTDLSTKQAYLSYPESQAEFAQLVRGWLCERDFQVHVTNSHRDVKEAEALVRQSDCLVLFVCQDYMDSSACKREANAAYLADKFIAAVRNHAFEPSGWLAMLLGARPVSHFSQQGGSPSDVEAKALLLQRLSNESTEDDVPCPVPSVSQTGSQTGSVQPVLPTEVEAVELLEPEEVPSTDRLFELDDDSTVTVGAMKQLLQPLQMQVLELTQRMEAMKQPRSKTCCIM